MTTAFWSLTSVGVGHGRVRGGMEWFRGEVQWVGARRIELRRRGFAGATSGGGFARCCSLELGSSCTEEEKGGLGRHGKLRGVRERIRAASGAIADTWTRSPATNGGMGVGAQYRAQEFLCSLV